MNSLKGHIDAALRGSETTGVNVNPWRIGDGYTTPNIHQPWTPSPSDIKAREWERIMREVMNTPDTNHHLDRDQGYRRSSYVEKQDDKVQRDRLYGLPL
ncbi:hypothetical protein [Pectobacterium phage PcCB7V]|nr:hypothetical protein [Pectobacterium phage PcCB7V]